MELQKFSGFALKTTVDHDRNKIYYGFIHNFSSEHTRDAYMRDLKKFLQFLSVRFRGMDEFKVELPHVVMFKDQLVAEDYSPKSINRVMSCLWSFYEYLIDMKYIERNPVERVKRFKVEKTVKTQDLSDQEVVDLLGAINTESDSGKLHKAVLTLFFTTGMRHREVSHLRFRNLDEENGFTIIRYKAKGGSEMIHPLNPKAEAALAEYLQSVKFEMKTDDYIFRGTKGNGLQPLDPKSLNYIIKKYAKKIGVKGRITIHSARSTVIGMLLDKGHSIERVADFVGHKDMAMTRAYNKRRLKIHQSLGMDL